MSSSTTPGLRFEQAPPLSIPGRFFVTAPVAIAFAGIMMLFEGNQLFLTSWASETIAFTHLATLGFLAMIIFGALYQMTPVVAGSPVPYIHIAKLAHGAFSLSIIILCSGIGSHTPALVAVARWCLLPALLLLAVPITYAIVKAPTQKLARQNDTVNAMQLAMLAMWLTLGLGLVMASGHANGSWPRGREHWLAAHLGLALLGWVGGLITAVSWQVLPMFYLAKQTHRILTKSIRFLLIIGITSLGLSLLIGKISSAQLLDVVFGTLGLVSLALAVWVIAPAATLYALAHRRRKRTELSLRTWQMASCFAVLALATALISLGSHDNRWALQFGWIAIWGWAALLMHGMLLRIVPFLVWFHRFSPLVGKVRTPSMKKLLPKNSSTAAIVFHVVTLVLASMAIWTGSDIIARVTGLSLLTTAVLMELTLYKVFSEYPQL